MSHILNTNHQYNLPPIGKKIAYKSNRDGVAERFADPGVREIVRLDLELIGEYDRLLTDLELQIVKRAKQHDAQAFHRLFEISGLLAEACANCDLYRDGGGGEETEATAARGQRTRR